MKFEDVFAEVNKLASGTSGYSREKIEERTAHLLAWIKREMANSDTNRGYEFLMGKIKEVRRLIGKTDSTGE